MKIKASDVLFIKLGRQGIWEADCIEKDHTLRLGFHKVDHDDSLAGKWQSVTRELVSNGKAKGTVTFLVNQIKKFYESDRKVLWITFYGGRMWWCFSEPEITKLADGSKTRPVIGKWNDKDVNGNILTADKLRGDLVTMQRFQGTICNVELKEYVLQKINGLESNSVREAKIALIDLEKKIATLIRCLHWKDFEILVDLVFRHAGWQRIAEVGKTMKTLDLDLFAPVTHERCLVQIKSASNLKEFNHYCKEFQGMGAYQKFFYVVHTPSNLLQSRQQIENVKLLMVDDLAKLVVNAGLTDWVISKNS